MRINAKDRLVSFKVIHLDVPNKFISQGLKAEKEVELYRRVLKEINKAEQVQNKINHLLSVYDKIRLRVGA